MKLINDRKIFVDNLTVSSMLDIGSISEVFLYSIYINRCIFVADIQPTPKYLQIYRMSPGRPRSRRNQHSHAQSWCITPKTKKKICTSNFETSEVEKKIGTRRD